jgi:hypothetical protein
MSQSSRFASQTERWMEELWNVSLFPVASRQERPLTPSGLENVDEGRRPTSIRRPLGVSLDSSGGILI